MAAILYIPWFRPEPLVIPFPGTDGLPIHAFGVLVAVGVLVGAKVADIRAQKTGVSTALVADLVTWVVAGGFILGHVLDAVFYHPERVAENPLFLLELWNGLSSFGGFIGALLGLLLWRWRTKVPMLPVADAIAFAFPTGWLFGRTGCFVVHDHPGIPSDFFLAVADYQVGKPPWVPRHDLGFYEILWSLAVIALFFWLARKPRKFGFFLALLAITYAPVRFFLDFLRADAETGGDIRYLAWTPAQYGCLLLLVAGTWLMWYVHQRSSADPPTHAPTTSTGSSAALTDAGGSITGNSET